jgi:phage tail sheath protein FI
VPEYLAPGVYVEETSFRAKSIEGVSTSTTGFVGPTRRGPLAPRNEADKQEAPELVTSFGDFQRIYGGFEDLDFGTMRPNYLAHAVRAYFDNGGARLYVARISDGSGVAAQSSELVAGTGMQFVARTPGKAGNGRITVVPHFAEATARSLDRAPQGTTLRTGAKKPATGAKLPGTLKGPFILPKDGKLTLRVNAPSGGTDVPLTGTGAEAPAATAAAANISLDPGERDLTVTIDGVQQTITLPAGPTPLAQIVELINSGLVGGYARLATGKVAIGSDVQGTDSTVKVSNTGAGPDLGFTAEVNAVGGGTLPNVRRVTAQHLAARIGAVLPDVVVNADADGKLILTTKTTGTGANLTVVGGTGTVNGLLGLADGASATGTAGTTIRYYVKEENSWIGATTFNPSELADGAEVVTIGVVAEDGGGLAKNYDDLGLATKHPRFIGNVLAASPSRRADALENVFAFKAGTATDTQLRGALLPTGDAIGIPVTGGTDGGEPRQADYEAGLRQLAQVEDISIVAAPGESSYGDHQGIQGALISHCERRRAYRIAVLDTAPGIVPSEARTERARIDSTYAALYYPWVVVSNPLARVGDESIPREIALPPSGFVAGIYARSDIDRGVFKAPANEIVRGALRYDVDVNFAQQEVLNPLGINCLRFFPGRGNRVWGARTASSDPEWKYVNVRRYFNYLERSIDVSTQWAVFEPNGEALWANIKDTITDFLINEWRSGALLGSQKEAFFVRCDRSTMDQNDLDNGRLVCLIGVAVVKPAEFVIFRIGQKTADARS